MRSLDFLTRRVDLGSPSQVAAYDDLPLWSAMFGLLLLEEVPLSGVDSVLDLGCGTGFPLIELAERLGEGCAAHGVDIWTGALARAREKAVARGTGHVVLHEGSASALPFPDGSFALIVSNLGLNNFDDRETAVRECRRVARPDARLALTTNLQGHMQEFYGEFRDVLISLGDHEALRRLEQHVAHRATITGVQQLLANNGFTVTRIVQRDGAMRFATSHALANHYFVRLGFLDEWKAVAGERQSDVFAQLLDRLDDVVARDGELRLTIPMTYIEAAVSS